MIPASQMRLSSAYLSAHCTPFAPLLTHLSGKQARIARGRTYSAISPLLRPCSIHILPPHTRLPVNVHPKGPSQTSWETQGRSRARRCVRVRQTAAQIDATNVLRKDALRRTARSVVRSLERRRR